MQLFIRYLWFLFSETPWHICFICVNSCAKYNLFNSKILFYNICNQVLPVFLSISEYFLCKITVQSTLLILYWFNLVRIGITLETEERLNIKNPSYTRTGIPTHYVERTVLRLHYSCNEKLYTQKCDLYIENHFSSQWTPYSITVHYFFNHTLISSIDAGSSMFSDSIADKSETSTSRFSMRKDIALEMISLCSGFIWNLNWLLNRKVTGKLLM